MLVVKLVDMQVESLNLHRSGALRVLLEMVSCPRKCSSARRYLI